MAKEKVSNEFEPNNSRRSGVVPVAVLRRPDLSRGRGAGWLRLRGRGGSGGSGCGRRDPDRRRGTCRRPLIVPVTVLRRPDFSGRRGAGLLPSRGAGRGGGGREGRRRLLAVVANRGDDADRGDRTDRDHEENQSPRHSAGPFSAAAGLGLLPASTRTRFVSSDPHSVLLRSPARTAIAGRSFRMECGLCPDRRRPAG